MTRQGLSSFYNSAPKKIQINNIDISSASSARNVGVMFNEGGYTTSGNGSYFKKLAHSNERDEFTIAGLDGG